MQQLICALVIVIAASAAGAQPSPQPPAGPSSTVAERAQFYQRIASLESTATLALLAREAASAAGPVARERLELILERHFELDPAGTVRLAGELFRGPDAMQVAPYYERLARVDVNAALSALSQVDDPVQARVAAAVVFRGLGGDERARELVAASLQGAARQDFRADTLLQLASVSPRAALAEALALPDPDRRRSLAMPIVASWANEAPRDALEAVERIQDPELRELLRPTVLRSWRDPDSLAAYLAGLDAEARRTAIASGALERLIQADPSRAAELAAELPAGDERRRVLMHIATVYAQEDPDAALAWAQTLKTPDPQLINMILRGIATKDPVRAFDVAGSLEEPARSQAYFTVISGPVSEERQFSTLASRIREMPEGQAKTALLVTLVGSWASRPDNAVRTLDWMLASGTALPAEAFERVGYIYAQTDPAGAAAYVDRVPSTARGAWVVAVVGAYANTDVQRATAFLDRFRGDPAFDRAAVMLTQHLAVSDPPAAARLLASVRVRGSEGPTAEMTIARQWALRDPAAATAWALDLPVLTRTMAMSVTAGTWAQQDPGGLESWALRLPSGEQRDAALGAVIRARGAVPPNAALLNAFSDDRARQGAVMSTILATAQADPAAARLLIDGYITEPRLRTQAEQVVGSIERGEAPFPTGASGGPAGVFVGTPPFVGAMPGGTVGPPVTLGPNGQPITVIGPNGQPVMIRSPVAGAMLPPGAVSVGPLPPPPVMPMPPTPTATDEAGRE